MLPRSNPEPLPATERLVPASGGYYVPDRIGEESVETGVPLSIQKTRFLDAKYPNPCASQSLLPTIPVTPIELLPTPNVLGGRVRYATFHTLRRSPGFLQQSIDLPDGRPRVQDRESNQRT